MDDLTKVLDPIIIEVKSKLEKEYYLISDIKYINYGVQLYVTKGSWQGILRVFTNKKSEIRYDYSPINDSKVKDDISWILGNEEKINKELKSKNIEIKPSAIEVQFPLIGTDESGKGDYFGPLVTAGVYVDSQTKLRLEDIGVKDSKKISDNKILLLAQQIKIICNNQYAIIEISPETYNNLYEKFISEGKNLNTLLAWGHAKAIEEVLSKVDCDNALSDKFADEKFILSKLQEKGKKITLRQEHKAESNIAVAAASILARARFLEKMRKLSLEYEINLHKGVSKQVVEQAKSIVKKKGKDALNKIAKIHFKTTNSIFIQ